LQFAAGKSFHGNLSEYTGFALCPRPDQLRHFLHLADWRLSPANL
jgi:hypothetical protein